MAYKSFELNIDNYIARLAFNRPEKSNALREQDWEEMKQVFEALDQDDRVRVIILSGKGKHFCAGMDIETLFGITQAKDAENVEQSIYYFIIKIQSCITAIERCSKPVIASVHGGCIGGGVDIATACDMRFSTEEGYFTIKEIDLGIVADIGTLQRLPNIIHPGIAAELAYTGRKFYGLEAKQIGFVNDAFATPALLEDGVNELAMQIAQKSPLCIRGIKRTLLFKRDHSVDESLTEIAQYNSKHLISPDLMEAMQAYMEKRPPVFKP